MISERMKRWLKENFYKYSSDDFDINDEKYDYDLIIYSSYKRLIRGLHYVLFPIINADKTLNQTKLRIRTVNKLVQYSVQEYLDIFEQPLSKEDILELRDVLKYRVDDEYIYFNPSGNEFQQASSELFIWILKNINRDWMKRYSLLINRCINVELELSIENEEKTSRIYKKIYGDVYKLDSTVLGEDWEWSDEDNDKEIHIGKTVKAKAINKANKQVEEINIRTISVSYFDNVFITMWLLFSDKQRKELVELLINWYDDEAFVLFTDSLFGKYIYNKEDNPVFDDKWIKYLAGLSDPYAILIRSLADELNYIKEDKNIDKYIHEYQSLERQLKLIDKKAKGIDAIRDNKSSYNQKKFKAWVDSIIDFEKGIKHLNFILDAISVNNITIRYGDNPVNIWLGTGITYEDNVKVSCLSAIDNNGNNVNVEKIISISDDNIYVTAIGLGIVVLQLEVNGNIYNRTINVEKGVYPPGMPCKEYYVKSEWSLGDIKLNPKWKWKSDYMEKRVCDLETPIVAVYIGTDTDMYEKIEVEVSLTQ